MRAAEPRKVNLAKKMLEPNRNLADRAAHNWELVIQYRHPHWLQDVELVDVLPALDMLEWYEKNVRFPSRMCVIGIVAT